MTVKHNLLSLMDEHETKDDILDEELELDLELEGNEDTEAQDKKDKIIKSLVARAKKAEAIARKLKSQPQHITKQEEPKDFFEDERLDLLSKGYDKPTIKFIMQNGGTKALEDPNSLVSIAVKAQMEQRKAELAAMATEDTSALSEVERKYTPEQLANMSVEELEKILPKAD